VAADHGCDSGYSGNLREYHDLLIYKVFCELKLNFDV